jgi:peptidyl-prolyl cis-trans isomerase C
MNLSFYRSLAQGAVWCALAFTSAAVSAQDLVRVDGQAITAEQVAAVNPAAASDAALGQQILEQLVQQQLLASTVTKMPDELRTRVEAVQANAKRQVLAQWAAQEYLRMHPIENTAIEEQYRKVIASLPSEQYWVRWIVLSTPEQAQTVLDALKSGKQSFTQMAISQSVGQNAELGGALGWQTEQTLPAAVLGAVRKLRPLEAAGPIALDNGFAIVQLIAQRNTPTPTLAQLKPQIEQQLRNQLLQEYVAALAKQAKIENLTSTGKAPAQTAPEKQAHDPS